MQSADETWKPVVVFSLVELVVLGVCVLGVVVVVNPSSSLRQHLDTL